MTDLANARIISIAQNVPGPLAVARLKRAGASVVKIEPPAGDPFLVLSPAWHAEMHEGIAIERLDLKAEAGRTRILELLRGADLFVTSQRPSSLERLGLTATALRDHCPRLRLLRIVGSLLDPERPGHDLTYQAQVGIIGEEMPRTLLADVMASERAFGASLQLLQQPAGSTINIGLVESLDAVVAPLRHGLTTPTGALGGGWPRYGIYRANDGRVAVAALEPQFESRLYHELGVAAGGAIGECFLARTAMEWEAWARERELPIVAIRGDGRPTTATA